LRRQKGGDWTSPMLSLGGHVWSAFIKRHKAEFDKDPTMLALRRGARRLGAAPRPADRDDAPTLHGIVGS